MVYTRVIASQRGVHRVVYPGIASLYTMVGIHHPVHPGYTTPGTPTTCTEHRYGRVRAVRVRADSLLGSNPGIIRPADLFCTRE